MMGGGARHSCLKQNPRAGWRGMALMMRMATID